VRCLNTLIIHPQHNILLDFDDVPKIADLGMSRVVHAEGNSTSTGPYSSAMKLFMPHDVRKVIEEKNQNREPTLKPDFSTDTYSCGVVLLSVSLPEPECSVNSVQAILERLTSEFVDQNTTSADCTMPEEFHDLPGSRSEHYWRLIQQMTSWENTSRPNMSKVREDIHSLFG
jgi:serine/threonine protein kinase